MNALKKNFLMVKLIFIHTPKLFFSSLVGQLGGIIISLTEILFIRAIIDMAFNKTDTTIAIWTILGYFAAFCVGIYLEQRHNRYYRHLYRYVFVKKMQRVMFEKAKVFDVECYDDPAFYDKFTRALKEGDVRACNVFDNVMSFLGFLLKFVILGSLVIITDWIILVVLVIQCLLNYFIRNKNNKDSYQTNKKTETERRKQDYVRKVMSLEQYVAENKTTRAYEKAIELYDESTSALVSEQEKLNRRTSRRWFMDAVIHHLIRTFFLYSYLAYCVIYRDMEVATLTSLIAAFAIISGTFDRLIDNSSRFKEHALYIDDYVWFMKYTPKNEIRKGKEVKFDEASLIINGISFKYKETDELNVLNNLSMEVSPGEKIAIVGHNGAGKTTLIKLLLKFYVPETGSICINDENYKDLNEYSLRQNFVSVFQNFQIYALTVAENVLLRRVINDDDEKLVWEALEKAELASFVRKMPKGINTMLTREFDDDGYTLSGGEKQKVALARIFASKAPIIILDEPSSALDPIAEYDINRTIIREKHDKTIILISHRLSTVVDAKRIYLIDNGTVAESGTHNELMNVNGLYRKMFDTQAQAYKQEQKSKKQSECGV